MNKKQVQEAVKRIDEALASIPTNRESHIVLSKDLLLLQQCCESHFAAIEATVKPPATTIPIKPEPEKENGGTDKPTKRPESGDQNS